MADIYVAKSGGDTDSIAIAIALQGNNDTIHVKDDGVGPTRYSEPVASMGNNHVNRVIRGWSGNTYPVIWEPAAAQNRLLTMGSGGTGFELRDIQCEDPSSLITNAFIYTGASNSNNCVVSNVKMTCNGALCWSWGGIGMGGWEFTDSEFLGTVGDETLFGTGSLYNSWFRRCSFHDCMLVTGYGNSVYFERCEFYNGWGNEHWVRGIDVQGIFYNCIFVGNRYGIQLVTDVNNYIYNCLFYGQGDHGITANWAGSGGNAYVRNCAFVNLGGWALAKSTTSVPFSAPDRCLFHNLGSGVDMFNWWGNSPINSYYTDPLFTDPGSRDFTFDAASDLRDNGMDLSGNFTDDFNGTSRPQGDGWDIGPIEMIFASGWGGKLMRMPGVERALGVDPAKVLRV